MSGFLGFFGRHGKFVLVAGLVAGIALPDLAATMKPWLPELVASLLFVAGLRIGPKEIFSGLEKLPSVLNLVVVFQIVLPLALAGIFWLAGTTNPIAFAIVLMASASSISGAPNLVILTGNDAAPAMRLLIAGTALLPLTVLPVLWVVPQVGDVLSVLSASGRLVLLIGIATLAAALVRKFVSPKPEATTLAAFDGLSAITMAIVVVGLMSAIGPALAGNLSELFVTLIAACAVNWGLQLLAFFTLRDQKWAGARVSYSIIAGNRNMALFLAALPVAVTDPILLFIGCYQIPMYLTPIVMSRIYRAA